MLPPERSVMIKKEDSDGKNARVFWILVFL